MKLCNTHLLPGLLKEAVIFSMQQRMERGLTSTLKKKKRKENLFRSLKQHGSFRGHLALTHCLSSESYKETLCASDSQWKTILRSSEENVSAQNPEGILAGAGEMAQLLRAFVACANSAGLATAPTWWFAALRTLVPGDQGTPFLIFMSTKHACGTCTQVHTTHSDTWNR